MRGMRYVWRVFWCRDTRGRSNHSIVLARAVQGSLAPAIETRGLSMSGLFNQGWLRMVCTVLCVGTGTFATPAWAGDHHDCGTKYDLVQGYIIQPACAPSAPAQAPAPQTTPSAQTPGVTATAPQITIPATTQVTLAPPQLQLSLAPAPAPTVAVQMVPATPVQMVSLAVAPVQQLQLAISPAPLQTVQLSTTQVQYVYLQAAQAPIVSLTAQPQATCQTAVVATPVQLLIPQHRWCHFFGR